jgi:hypothetical protein
MKATPRKASTREAAARAAAGARAVLRRAALVALLALPLAPAATAAQGAEAPARPGEPAALEEYAARVYDATFALDALADMVASGETAMTEEKTLADVRRWLPRAERVRWPGGAVAADNAWLHEALDSYEEEAEGLRARERAERLREIAARLAALAARLEEAQGEAEAGLPQRDKDAEKGRLNDILRRPEYNRPEERQGGALQRAVDRFFEWLRDLFPDIRLRPGAAGGLSQAAQYLIFGAAIAVVAYVVWRFWRRRERGVRKEPLGGARVVLGERLEAGRTAADLLEEAERLAREGNLRAAIRKAYVALLCELADRKVIGLAQHKTNRDYLQAVRQGAPRLYTELLPLTFNFELHWYGAQEASAADWDDFRARCRQALTLAKS